MKADAPLVTAARATPEVSPMRTHSTCSIADCDQPSRARGWCDKHLQRWYRRGDPLVTLNPAMEQTADERFWAKVERREPDQCWPWTGSQDGKGYGRFWDGTRHVQAHRWAYEAKYGPIPKGLTIDHLCRTHNCVNSHPLEVRTNRLNILRGVAPSAVNARKTHCIRGHLFDDANTYVPRNGRRSRTCRACARYRWARARR